MSFAIQHNICKTNIVLNDYHAAYTVLKEAKSLILSTQEETLYYQTLIQILNHLGYKSKAYKVCDKVIFSDMSWDIKNEFINHQSFLISRLNANDLVNLNCPTPQYYNVSSPSILPTKDGYLCNLRLVNYLYHDGNFTPQDGGAVNTLNYMVNLDFDYNIQHMWEINECDNLTIYPAYVKGMEDVRLFGPNY